MICLDSISVMDPDMDAHDVLTSALGKIVDRTKSLIGKESGVVVVTSGAAESLQKVMRIGDSVIASFFEPVGVTSMPNCCVVPVLKSGNRSWDKYLLEPSRFKFAYISVVDEEYGVVSDLSSISSMIKELSPGTIVIADMTYAMSPEHLESVNENVDVVVFDGSFCGLPHLGAIWARSPDLVGNNTSVGYQQFGLRSGHLCSRSCDILSDGLLEVSSIKAGDTEKIRAAQLLLERAMLRQEGVFLNFPEAPRAAHTSNFHIQGVWTKPLVMSLRKLGVFVTDTVGSLINTALCSPMTSFMFDEHARYSNVLFRVGPHNTDSDIENAVDFLLKGVSISRQIRIEGTGDEFT